MGSNNSSPSNKSSSKQADNKKSTPLTWPQNTIGFGIKTSGSSYVVVKADKPWKAFNTRAEAAKYINDYLFFFKKHDHSQPLFNEVAPSTIQCKCGFAYWISVMPHDFVRAQGVFVDPEWEFTAQTTTVNPSAPEATTEEEPIEGA